MLSKIEVASGKYTVVFLPRNKKSPGRRPMGRCMRPSSMHARPAATMTKPNTTSTLPKSAIGLGNHFGCYLHVLSRVSRGCSVAIIGAPRSTTEDVRYWRFSASLALDFATKLGISFGLCLPSLRCSVLKSTFPRRFSSCYFAESGWLFSSLPLVHTMLTHCRGAQRILAKRSDLSQQ